MRTLLLCLLAAIAWSAEVSRAEQDRIWAEAMRQSAEVTVPPAVVVVDVAKTKPLGEPDAQRQKEAAQFLAWFGMPETPSRKIVAALTEIPDKFCGTLLRNTGDTMIVVGSISKQLVQLDRGRGFVLKSVSLCDDGGLLFDSEGRTYSIRLSKADGGSIVFMVVMDDARLASTTITTYALRR